MLTRAYRGVGIFSEKLPVRIVGSYPSYDRFVIALRSSLGFTSLADVKATKYPLKVSVREDPTHSTLVLIEQLFAAHDMTLTHIESWGGEIQRVGGPGSTERLDALRAGRMDAVLDEGIRTWLPVALDNGLAVLEPEPEAFAKSRKALGWRRVVLPKSLYPQMPADRACIDFSGWPLYARASLPDRVAYDVCAAFAAREARYRGEENTCTGIAQVHETDATPMDVPLHPGAARWYEEHPNG